MLILGILRAIVIALAAVIAICAAFRIYALKRRLKGLRIAHKNKARGIIFGRIGISQYVLYSPCSAEKHVLVLGGSGEGKTSSILIPTLRSWMDGAFVIDISGDISSNVDCLNKLVFQPESAETVPYNIFYPIDKMNSLEEKNEAIAQLALLLMPPQINTNAAAKYFFDGGRKILTAAIIAYYHAGMDFCDICKRIIALDYKTLFNDIESKSTAAATYISGFFGNSEQNIAGCKAECDAAIALFAQNHRLAGGVRRPAAGEVAITPDSLEKNKVFICIDDTKLELFSPLLSIITAQMLQYLAARPNNAAATILLALDEFASLGKQEITPALRKLRKKKVRIMLLTQSLADLDMIYGREERTAMLNNLAYKVILSAADTDTQEYFAKLCGRKKSTRQSRSNTGTVTDSEVDAWAIEPDKLGKLHPKLLLIHPAGFVFLRKNYYFKK